MVNGLLASGQHDDPDTKILTQPAGEGQSVFARQHHIEDDETTQLDCEPRLKCAV